MLRFNVAIFMIDVLVYISCIEDIVYYSILFDFTSTAVIFQEDNVLGLWHRTPTTWIAAATLNYVHHFRLC